MMTIVELERKLEEHTKELLDWAEGRAEQEKLW